MNNPLCLLLLIFTVTGSIQAGENLTHHTNHSDHAHHRVTEAPSTWMFGYQFGFSRIVSNNEHMSNDSGVFLGLHAMKNLENDLFKRKLYFATGVHTTFTDDKHIGAMIGIMFQINNQTILSIMPGIMWMKHSKNHSMDEMDMNMDMGNMSKMYPVKAQWESEYGTHIEISYKMVLFGHLLNPNIGWMCSSSHDQYTLGFNFHF
jgi:hypothetical protein